MPIDSITHRIRTGLNNVFNRNMNGIDLLTILMINLVLVHGPRSLSIVLLFMLLLTPKLSSLHAELTRPCNECSIQTHTFTNLISIIPIFKAIGTIFLLLLLLSEDVELNPGPNDLTENSSEISSDSFEKFLEKSITLVHLNVQSLTNKLDIIQAEFEI